MLKNGRNPTIHLCTGIQKIFLYFTAYGETYLKVIFKTIYGMKYKETKIHFFDYRNILPIENDRRRTVGLYTVIQYILRFVQDIS